MEQNTESVLAAAAVFFFGGCFIATVYSIHYCIAVH